MQPHMPSHALGVSTHGNTPQPEPGHSPSDAFAGLVEKHSPLVLGVCTRMLGQSLAQDAAQAVFILLWQKGKGLKEEAAVASWLYRTATHVCLNARRSHLARVKHEQAAAVKELPMSADDPQQEKWSEIRAWLDEEVARLPEKWRIPFILFHFENRSLAQIGELLNATQSTVGTWLKRAREHLAANLTRRGITVSGATLVGVLASHLPAQAISPTFVQATVAAVQGFALGGGSAGAAPSPVIAALVQEGVGQGVAVQGWLRAAAWLLLILALPFGAFFLFPLIQTQQSPDFPLLQGEWREIANEQGGAMLSTTTPVAYVGTLLISGNQFQRFQTLADGKVLQGERGSFVLDDRTDPKSIDFKVWFRSAHAIYEVDGDQLNLCTARDGEKRPTEMTTSPGDNRILTRYRRVR